MSALGSPIDEIKSKFANTTQCITSIAKVMSEVLDKYPKDAKDNDQVSFVPQLLVLGAIHHPKKSNYSVRILGVNMDLRVAYPVSDRFALAVFKPPRPTVVQLEKGEPMLIFIQQGESVIYAHEVSLLQAEHAGHEHKEISVRFDITKSDSRKIFKKNNIPVPWAVLTYSEGKQITVSQFVIYIDTRPSLARAIPPIPDVTILHGISGEAHVSSSLLPRPLPDASIDIPSANAVFKDFGLETIENRELDDSRLIAWGELSDLAISATVLDLLKKAGESEMLHSPFFLRKVLKVDEVGKKVVKKIKEILYHKPSGKSEGVIDMFPSLFSLLMKTSSLPASIIHEGSDVKDNYMSTIDEINRAVEESKASMSTLSTSSDLPEDEMKDERDIYNSSEEYFLSTLDYVHSDQRLPMTMFGESKNYIESCLVAMFLKRYRNEFQTAPQDIVSNYINSLASVPGSAVFWSVAIDNKNWTSSPPVVMDLVSGCSSNMMLLSRFVANLHKSHPKILHMHLSYSYGINGDRDSKQVRHMSLCSLQNKHVQVVYAHGLRSRSDRLAVLWVPQGDNLFILHGEDKGEPTNYDELVVKTLEFLKTTKVYTDSASALKDTYIQDIAALPLRCYVRSIKDIPKETQPVIEYSKTPYTSGYVTPSTATPLTAVVAEDPNQRPGVVNVKLSDNRGQLAEIPVVSDGMRSYILKPDDTFGEVVVLDDKELIILGVTFLSDMLPIIENYKKTLAEATRQSSISHAPYLQKITQTIIYDPPDLTMKTYVTKLVGCNACGGKSKLGSSGVFLSPGASKNGIAARKKSSQPSSSSSSSSQPQGSIGHGILPVLAAGTAGAVLGGALARSTMYPYGYPYGYSYGYPYSIYDPYVYPRPLIRPAPYGYGLGHRRGHWGRRHRR